MIRWTLVTIFLPTVHRCIPPLSERIPWEKCNESNLSGSTDESFTETIRRKQLRWFVLPEGACFFRTYQNIHPQQTPSTRWVVTRYSLSCQRRRGCRKSTRSKHPSLDERCDGRSLWGIISAKWIFFGELSRVLILLYAPDREWWVDFPHPHVNKMRSLWVRGSLGCTAHTWW